MRHVHMGPKAEVADTSRISERLDVRNPAGTLAKWPQRIGAEKKRCVPRHVSRDRKTRRSRSRARKTRAAKALPNRRDLQKVSERCEYSIVRVIDRLFNIASKQECDIVLFQRGRRWIAGEPDRIKQRGNLSALALGQSHVQWQARRRRSWYIPPKVCQPPADAYTLA